jgi:acyl carrier protein
MVTDGHTPTVGELRRVLVDTVPDYMVPSRYVVLETFPRRATGKIDRRAVPPPDGVRPAVGTSFVPPRTPVEERLAAIWAEVLRLDRVGVYDRFLELGGDSLLATLVISRVIEQLHVQVSPHVLLAAPTVAKMAEVILLGLAGKLEMSALDRMLTDLEAQPRDE